MDPQARTPTHEGRHRPARMLLTPPDRAPGTGPDPREVMDLDDVAEVVPDGVAPDSTAPRLVTLPASLRAADLGVGARAVRGLLLLALVGCLALGVRWWWVEQQASAVPVGEATGWSQDDADGAPPDGPGTSGESGGAQEAGHGDAPDEEPGGDAAPGGTHGDAPTTGPQTVIVHVVGEVQAPGVVELPTGSRVGDAVQAAGGFTDAADAGSVNLARALLDGEQVWVGAPGEDPPALAPAPAQGGTGTAAGPGGSGTTPGTGPVVPLDLNTATQAQLEELPGIGPVTAGRILTWRDENGRFTDPTELLEVSGIGERTLEQLAPLVRAGG
ncbi:helix-hairpin-helix domain-containing protein [Ornithinimicrobium sp. LYQ92]|uniref:helix-hairpin-helix domain-containing protein n=1 Tax=Serinicoccus sp. LYQ92 TaxID=3378798 RepID=UPI003854126F